VEGIREEEKMAAPLASTCAATCGKWTDASSQAVYDLSPLCGKELIYNETELATTTTGTKSRYSINICGRVKCFNSEEAKSEFCVQEDVKLCGIDSEATTEGMILKTEEQPCGALSCGRCDVLARPFDGMIEYSLIEASPFKGVALMLPAVPLTLIQRDHIDKLGFCDGSGAERQTKLDMICNCHAEDGIIERISQEAPSSCLTTFQIRSKFACYDGFCAGLAPPGLQSGANGVWIALSLIFLVISCLVVVKKRGHQRLIGLTERFSKPAARYSGLRVGSQAAPVAPDSGDDEEGERPLRSAGDDGL
jgi:hypothetical protein